MKKGRLTEQKTGVVLPLYQHGNSAVDKLCVAKSVLQKPHYDSAATFRARTFRVLLN